MALEQFTETNIYSIFNDNTVMLSQWNEPISATTVYLDTVTHSSKTYKITSIAENVFLNNNVIVYRTFVL